MIPLKQMDEDFAIDSFPTPKKRKILRTIYPENKDERMKKRAMIDLDGTIHKYSKGYADGTIYDDPFEGAKEVIDYLKNNGYEIVIFTTRASKQNANELGGNHLDQIKKIEEWLKKNNIYFDKITAEKLAADFYIDDKAINISNGDWKVVLNVIKKRIKYKRAV
jgi:FMN phosphatase YigB (HAD superfamily)